jgi:hypothetical protein
MKQWDSLIQSAGQKYNVDPKLIAALVRTESGGDPNAYNAEFGATGLGQQIPATAKALGIDPKDPAQSIEGVAKLLNENLNRYGSPEQAVLAYHGGTDQANWGPKTQDYLRKVSANYGAPQVARPSAIPDDEFEAAFGARPAPVGKAAAPAADEFEAAFGPRPTAAPTVATAPVPAATQAPSTANNSIPGLAMQGLEKLGEIGIGNVQAAGRGISDVLDAPSEWLAVGAEKSGLTGLLGRAGINMPTAEQQVQINAQSRADYDARNPDAGIQQGASRIVGNLAGVLAPTIGAEAALVQGGRALSNAVGNPQLLTKAGEFLRGQGGLASRMTYNAGQGAAGGALLSGGQPDASLADSAGLGAILGGAVPVAGSILKYGANTGKALVAPFTESGRAGIAQRAIQGEAAKDPLNQAQNILAAKPGSSLPAPAAQAVERISADDAVNRAAAAGRIDANFDEIVPGSVPTLAQATGNAGLAALERAAIGRAPNAFAERNLSNYAARNAYMTEIKGTPETLSSAVAKRDEEALPFLRSALDNARPANANPVMDEIDTILKGRAGQRDEVVKALGRVKDKLDLGEGQGLQSSVEQLYGIRQSINDQLATVAGRDNSASQLASKELIQVRDKLDDSIQAAAPGFKEFLKTYSELSRPVDAQRYLQGLDLTDQTSQRITLNKVKSAINRIEKLRSGKGANEAKSISDEQLAMLRNLQTDLQREANSSRGMAIGSNTFQNFATNQLIDTMMPGKLGAVAPVTPGAIGGALGYALGGNVGAGIGAIAGQQAAGVAGRAMAAQGPEIEARLIDYLLNPRGAEVLRAGRASQTPAMDALLRRASPTAPASIATPGSQNNR